MKPRIPSGEPISEQIASRVFEDEQDEEPETVSERDEDDPYPDRVMVDAEGKPHYEP